MCRNTFRISCLNAATGAVTRPSERINPVYAGMRPTAHLPTFGPFQKDALPIKSTLQDRFGWTGISPHPANVLFGSIGNFESFRPLSLKVSDP
jgi:hypothetical protein